MMIPIRHLIASCALITILSGCRSIQRYGVSGSVLDAESGKPLKNALVMVAYASIWEEYPNVTVELKFQRTNHNGKYSIKDKIAFQRIKIHGGVKCDFVDDDLTAKYPCLIIITRAGYESKCLVFADPENRAILPLLEKKGSWLEKHGSLTWIPDWRECHHLDMINLIFDPLVDKFECDYFPDPKVDMNRKTYDVRLKRLGYNQLSNGR